MNLSTKRAVPDPPKRSSPRAQKRHISIVSNPKVIEAPKPDERTEINLSISAKESGEVSERLNTAEFEVE